MELDTGYSYDGTVDDRLSIVQTGEALFQLMLATTSGVRAKSELSSLGDNKFVLWQPGAVT